MSETDEIIADAEPEQTPVIGQCAGCHADIREADARVELRGKLWHPEHHDSGARHSRKG